MTLITINIKTMTKYSLLKICSDLVYLYVI